MRISPESLVSLTTPFKASDAAREERLAAAAAAEAKARDAKAALETLNLRRSQASEDRKAQARKKIEQLKARLQMLQSMAAADPKGTARLAAQLARELGAAVKEYAAAGGTTSGMTAAAPAAEAAPADGQAQAQAPAGGEVQDRAAGAGETPQDGTSDEAKAANPYQKAVDEAQARSADIARRGSESKADLEFLGETRRMAAQIKALIRKAAEAGPGDQEALPPGEAQDARAAAAAMDRELAQASADLTGGGVSLLV